MTAVAPGARVRPASPMARVASYLIDLAAVAAAGAIGFGLTRSWVIFAVVVFEAAVVFTLTRAATGLTLGALATRTIAHTFATAHAPGLHRQSLRSLLMGVLHLVAIGPVVSAATSRDGRDWVDRLVGTAVADIRLRDRTPAPQVAVNPYGRPTLAEPGSTTANLIGADATSPPFTDPGPAVPPIAPPVFEAHLPGTPPRRVALPTVFAILDTGTRVELGELSLFGRDPQDAAVPDDRRVAIADPGRSLSRTHVRVGVDASGIWVEDANSANGTWCRTPDGRVSQLAGGQRVRVVPGTIVGMGDRTMTITPGS